MSISSQYKEPPKATRTKMSLAPFANFDVFCWVWQNNLETETKVSVMKTKVTYKNWGIGFISFLITNQKYNILCWNICKYQCNIIFFVIWNTFSFIFWQNMSKKLNIERIVLFFDPSVSITCEKVCENFWLFQICQPKQN